MKDVLSKKKERIGTHSSQSKNKAIGKKMGRINDKK